MSETIKLKVCGLRDNAEAVLNEIKPDFAGFIFYDKSTRFVGEATKHLTAANAKKVGVFVDANYDEILTRIKSHSLQVVQLHGNETPELCLRLREHAEVIKVFSGNLTINTHELKSYEPFVDYFLFDTRQSGQPGGSGVSFNWDKLKKLSLDKPIILSGGIGLNDLEEIKTLDNIYAIDVNSRFEITPGLKNIELLKRIKDKLK